MVPNLNVHYVIRFPKNIELRRSWARACFLDEETVTDLILVCSKHFTEDDFDQTMWPARKLLPVAIPAPSLQYRKILPASKASLLADSSEMNLEITEVPDRSTTLQSDRVAPDTSAGHLNLTVSSTSTALSPASSVSSTSSTESMLITDEFIFSCNIICFHNVQLQTHHPKQYVILVT